MVRRTAVRPGRLIAAAALGLAPAPALAQALHCPLPAVLPRVFAERVPDDQEPVVVPVTGYLLALSWSPQHCVEAGDRPRDALQCRDGRFGFVLHGLWPQGRDDAPRWCAFARRLPDPLVRANLCVSPSAQLIQHQWAKHGTCSGTSPRDYLAASRIAFAKLRFPDMARTARGHATAGAVRDGFAAANRWLPARAIAVQVRDGWLTGVRLCLGTDLRPVPCPPRDRGAAPGRRVRIAAAGRS